jgi:hypothetical protein
VYAPALVGFVGGAGFGVSFAIGGAAGVAWFPLGPRDVWVPGYHASAVYFRNVNITNTRVVNVTQVNNVYVNRTTIVNNYTYAHNTVAVTAVSRETFVNGAPVSRAALRVNAEDMNHPRVMDAHLAPGPRSSFGPAPAARALPPAALANRPVVTRMAPSPSAVAVGHTQPLVNERAAYRPSAPPNGGQFSRPNNAGQNQPNGAAGGYRSFQPSTRPAGAVSGNGAAQPDNGSNPRTNPNTNNGFRPFQPPNRSNGNAGGNASGGSTPAERPEGQPSPAAATARTNAEGQPARVNPSNANPQNEERRPPASAASGENKGSSGAQTHTNKPAEKPPKKEKKDDEHK